MSKKDQAFSLFTQGKRPGDQEVKNLGLKPKTTYNYYQEWKKAGGVMGFKEEEGKGGKGSKGIAPSGVLRLTGTVIQGEYTPIMQMAQIAASEEWNWNPDIRFEDFIDTILYHFFKDRGITLQGYIVDEKVEAK